MYKYTGYCLDCGGFIKRPLRICFGCLAIRQGEAALLRAAEALADREIRNETSAEQRMLDSIQSAESN